MWPAAAVSVGIFIFCAFVVALFTEMYGFPLTIYLLTSFLGSWYPVIDPFTHINGHLWVALAGGSTLVWVLVMIVSNAAMFGGLIIMGKAWKQIHRANGGLVISGLYGRVRHPQYFALFLITVGMLIQWPTIITAAMWPILMFMYYRLARREEKEMESRFGDEYVTYRQQIPMLLPRLVTSSVAKA
jgi:protein-S-isoprenylcysteine O-methyltransferase Ste14